VSFGLLTKPTLYLSDFFERNKGAYYDALTVVRTSNDIEHWLKFFLVGVAETAANGKLTFENIITLRQRSEQRIIALGKRAKVGQELLKHLYSQPIVNAKQISERLAITYASASTLAKSFEEIGIFKEITGFKRNRLFLFAEYLDLFSSRRQRREKDAAR
jgi:Fic family protein